MSHAIRVTNWRPASWQEDPSRGRAAPAAAPRIPPGAAAAVPARRSRRPHVPGAGSRSRLLWALWYGAGGLLFGLIVLHPIAMVIFRWFDPGTTPDIHGPEAASALAPILRSFSPNMMPMGLVFGLFSAAIAILDGHYRGRVAAQRDQLALQAEELRLKHERLAQLEQANRRQTLFMVHDFKGHLAAIGGFAELLLAAKDPTRDPDEVDKLMRIRRQSVRMAGAVMDLLDIARLQESPALRRESTSLSALLRTAAADLSLPGCAGAVRIGSGHCDCPDVLVDRRLIERVLINLALNALKHNPTRTLVTLDAVLVPDPSEVAFTCTDNGRGIAVDALASLFEEFRSAARSDHGGSTGLGLAFCKAAVEAHGGRIWCDSVEGQGARFTFTVPRTPRGDSHDDSEAAHPGGR